MGIPDAAYSFILMGVTLLGYWIPAPRFHGGRLRGKDGWRGGHGRCFEVCCCQDFTLTPALSLKGEGIIEKPCLALPVW